MAETDEAKRKAILESFIPTADAFYKDYDKATDKDLFVNLMSMYKQNIEKQYLPSFFSIIDKKFKGSVARYADKMYATSFLTDRAKFDAFMAKPNAKMAEKDLALQAAVSVFEVYSQSFTNPSQEKYDRGYRLFVDGIRKMMPDQKFAPDANSTMRLTYGSVGDYFPADGVHYDYITTSKGILEKEDATNPEFIVPADLKSLLEKKDFGRWANENGDLVVCFISNNDITGGNSGSPVLNANGDLIGLAFDGNWEAMSGDIAFEPELQRTISVDIRYVMFILDKLAGAKNLIDEIDFVSASGK
jgi:hypothetical protein